MSSFITDEKGIWHPAKERVALKNLSGKPMKLKQKDISGKEFIQEIPIGGDYIYEGPCRAALFDLWEANGKPTEQEVKNNPDKLLTMGEGYRQNTEFLESYAKARSAHGFANVEEYLKYLGYDETKVKERFEKNASVVTMHDAPRRVNEIKRLGGGTDHANPGKNLVYGDFGEPAGVK